MLDVVPTSSRQCSLQRYRPILISLGEPLYLIGSQTKVAEHTAERLAVVDCVEELLPHLDR